MTTSSHASSPDNADYAFTRFPCAKGPPSLQPLKTTAANRSADRWTLSAIIGLETALASSLGASASTAHQRASPIRGTGPQIQMPVMLLESKGNRQASISSVVEALGRYYAPFYRPFSQAFGDLQPGDSFIRVRAFLPDASWEAFGRAPVAQLDRASDYESEG